MLPVRRLAVLAALALVAGSTALVASPAGAVSTTLSYNCTLTSPPAGPYVFTAVIDTDAPATLVPGQTVNLTTTSLVTVPVAAADALRGFGAKSVDGTADATGTVNNVARPTPLTIPRTATGAVGTTLALTGTGPSGNLVAGPVGTVYELGAGSFTAHMTGYNDAGTSIGTYEFQCLLQAGQNLHVDTVTVTKAPTTTTITLPATAQYGEQVSATADVTSGSGKPAGSVVFSFGGKTVKADVKGGKAKAILPAALTMGVQAVTATFTPTDATLAASATSRNLTVVRAQTTSATTVVYRAARHRLVAKDKVASAFGTPVTGKVRFVLKRDGVRIRAALVSVNEFGAAKKVFKRISKPGLYTVVARYLGSPTLKRSVDRVKVTV